MLTRQEFLQLLGAATFAACSSDRAKPAIDAPAAIDAPKPIDAPLAADAALDAPPAACASTNSAISANHGHAVTVSLADVMAGVDKTYDITGTSLHSHAITVTAVMFAMLKLAGDKIMVTSTVGAMHTHVVTITCA